MNAHEYDQEDRDYLKPKSRPLFVLAGSRGEFEQWRDKESDKRMAWGATYIENHRILEGKSDYLILRYGGWKYHGDLRAIERVHKRNVGTLGKFSKFEQGSKQDG